MLENATQTTRQMAVATPFPADALLLRRFSGSEELSRLFEYELEMVSNDDSLDPTQIVGENITWVLNQSGDAPRYWNAHVSRFRYSGQSDAGTTYRATVVPWLWFLTQTTDCRIFQNKTSPEIIQQIFRDLGFRDFRLQLSATYAKREYCVQYRETDFNFVSRLMEEEGIYYYFEHENAQHSLVLADDITSYSRLPDYEVEMADPNGHGDLVDQITVWEHETRFRPGKWAQTDFNFKKPGRKLMSTSETVMPVSMTKKFEVYEYPGCFSDRTLGSNLTKIRMQEHEADHDVVFGECTYRTFSPGGRFKVKKHLTAREIGREYTVRRITVEASLGGSYDSHLTSSEDIHYRCRFECLPAKLVFRPQRRTRKPVVEGPQTAIITGPPGEEIHPDEFGRVKAQFHWDREGKYDENSSCWLRVSQVHAGQGWGMMDLPRVGEEVIVDFLEGDPDRPIITGRVYNGDNMPPFALPAGKTRRGNMTKTYKGAGYNEMSMDDTPGKEQLRMNAMYNMNSNVNNDQSLTVGKNQSESVGVDRSREVGSNEKVKIGADRTVEVGSDHKEKVGGSQTVEIGANQKTTIGGSHTVSVGSSQSNTIATSQSNSIGTTKNETVGMASNEMVGMFKTVNVGVAMNTLVGALSAEEVAGVKIIIAGVSIALQCGASSLTMDAAGKIVLKGTNILIDSSGPTKINGGPIDLN